MDKVNRNTSSPTASPIAILGVPFDNVTTSQTIDLIDRMVISRRPHYLATANVDFLVQASQDVELRRILFDAHLVLCDGTPLVWASSLLGNPLPERVAGSDLVPLLLSVAAERGYRPFFLGATPEVADKAVAKLRDAYPALRIAGHYSPPISKLLDMDHVEITKRIREAQPDLLFVGFGCPKQEKWIAMHYRSLNVPVSVGVGATIDFLAGKVSRAPVWMQKSGTEWIFRLLQEPRRLFGRYMKDLWHFSRAILAQWWRLRSRPKKRATPAVVPVQEELSCKVITLPERLDTEAVHREKSVWEEALASHPNCFLDLSGVQFIDSTGVGLLIRLQKRARAASQQLILFGRNENVWRALRMMKLQDFFLSAPDLSSAKALAEKQRAIQPVLGRTSSSSNSLAWQGEVTAANAAEVWESTKKQFLAQSEPGTEFVIDLAAVGFIDSTGLGVMIKAKKHALQQGLKLSFVNIQADVLNVLRLARLEDYLLRK